MPITDWPAAERPREKLLQQGAASLSDAELLAIFLRTGLPGRSAVDLARDGIRVNALAPGVIETPMTEATRSDPALLARFMRRTPMHRTGRPEEVAAAVLFLASRLASYVNGITMPVDGGLLAT